MEDFDPERTSALAREQLMILRHEVMIGLRDVENGRLSDRTIEEIASDIAKADRRRTHPPTSSG